MTVTNLQIPQAGFALLMTMLVISVIIPVAITILDVTSKQVRLAGNARDSEVAFHAANAGLECAQQVRRALGATMESDPPADISVPCFGQTTTASPVTTIPSTNGRVHHYAYQLTWGTAPLQRCSQVDTILIVSDPSGSSTPPSAGSIVTSGLVMHLDAGNPASYPGSGLTLTDLSGNGNHGTLTGPTTITGGAINFNGTTNLTTTNLISNPQSFTIGIWFRTSSALGRKLIGLESSQTGGSGSYDRHFYVDTAGQLRWGVWSPGASTFLYGNVTDNAWRYAVVSFNNGAMQLSMNGVVIDNVTAAAAVFNGYWRIGGQSLNFWPSATAGFFVGSIAAVEIYNRPLSSAEITQNWNANRERFGFGAPPPSGGGSNTTVNTSDLKAVIPSYPNIASTKTCAESSVCTIISSRGYNRACPATLGGTFAASTIQREVLLEY